MADIELPEWITDHMQRYLATDGEDGHIFQGVPSLLLTTKGRKSGDPRMLPLIYGKSEDGFVLIASKGGAPAHPAWYLNLDADPNVQVQVCADKYDAIASTVTGERREHLWALMAEVWPAYNEYQTKTDREIPVVLITPK